MRKAFSLSFFIIGLMALVSVAVTKTQSHQSDEFETNEIARPLLSHHTDETQRARSHIDRKATKARNARALKAAFLDRSQPLESRLDAWIDLHDVSPLPFQSLVDIALSPNPYKKEPTESDLVLLRNYQREESFRIMALQSLERAILENEASILLIEQIAKNAASPTVRSIASKMYDFSREGHSYSNLFEQAVMALEVPR